MLFEPSEYGRLENVGEDYGGEESYEGRKTDTADGRMLSQKHTTHGDEKNDGGKDDCGLMIVEGGTCLV